MLAQNRCRNRSRGGKSVGLPLTFAEGRWVLDLDRLEKTITPKTRALFITPSNPTVDGLREDLKAILDIARRHGIWILADEIYALYYYGAARARALLPRRDGRGRPGDFRQFLLEELVDDRLACRLDRGAAGTGTGCWKTSSSIRHPVLPSSCSAVRS